MELVDELASTLSPLRPSLCYIEGYFVPQKISICKLIFERLCVEQRSQLVLNLNATYIVDQYPEDVLWLLKRSRFIFGNRREFDSLLRVAKAENIPQLLLRESSGGGDEDGKGGPGMDSRTCVITDGAKSVEYVRYEAKKKNVIQTGSVAVPRVSENSVVDSTGAGDAFVAGFLHQYLRACGGGDVAPEISLEDCIEQGVEVAQRKLAYLGCTLSAEE